MFEMLLADICTRALAALIPPPRDLCLDNGTAYRDQQEDGCKTAATPRRFRPGCLGSKVADGLDAET